MSTPTVLAKAREHFGCSSLLGLELEVGLVCKLRCVFKDVNAGRWGERHSWLALGEAPCDGRVHDWLQHGEACHPLTTHAGLLRGA